MSVVARASGKVILLGEHLVVHGAPALAAGIDRGAQAQAERLAGNEPSLLVLGADELVADPEAKDDRARAFAALLTHGDPLPPLHVRASSELPAGGGLGSSAALGVAIARATLAASGRTEDSIPRASAWERVFHGNPSGIDTAAAALGGCFRYTRKAGASPLTIAKPIALGVAYSGASSSTKTMVDGVARLGERKPEVLQRAIEGVTSLVDNAALALEAGDLLALGKLMDLNQMILAGLMLSTEPIEHLCSLARAAGALGAKLTGAGGGGSVIALLPEGRDQAVLAAWQGAGYQAFVTRVGAKERS